MNSKKIEITQIAAVVTCLVPNRTLDYKKSPVLRTVYIYGIQATTWWWRDDGGMMDFIVAACLHAGKLHSTVHMSIEVLDLSFCT